MSEQITVDIEALQNFHRTLTNRLMQLEQVRFHLDWLGSHPPRFGQFTEAQNAYTWYNRLHREHAAKVERLKQAITTSQQAILQIMAGYTGTDQTNAINLDKITALLAPITVALGEAIGVAEQSVSTVLKEIEF
jgi:hypothetical protein